MHYLLTYRYSHDYLARRGEFRDAHLRRAWELHDQGQLLIGGAVNDPADGAVLVFVCDGPELVEQFVQGDPYFQNGLVEHYDIQPWSTVVGAAATTPLRPQ